MYKLYVIFEPARKLFLISTDEGTLLGNLKGRGRLAHCLGLADPEIPHDRVLGEFSPVYTLLTDNARRIEPTT